MTLHFSSLGSFLGWPLRFHNVISGGSPCLLRGRAPRALLRDSLAFLQDLFRKYVHLWVLAAVRQSTTAVDTVELLHHVAPLRRSSFPLSPTELLTAPFLADDGTAFQRSRHGSP